MEECGMTINPNNELKPSVSSKNGCIVFAESRQLQDSVVMNIEETCITRIEGDYFSPHGDPKTPKRKKPCPLEMCMKAADICSDYDIGCTDNPSGNESSTSHVNEQLPNEHPLSLSNNVVTCGEESSAVTSKSQYIVAQVSSVPLAPGGETRAARIPPSLQDDIELPSDGQTALVEPSASLEAPSLTSLTPEAFSSAADYPPPEPQVHSHIEIPAKTDETYFTQLEPTEGHTSDAKSITGRKSEPCNDPRRESMICEVDESDGSMPDSENKRLVLKMRKVSSATKPTEPDKLERWKATDRRRYRKRRRERTVNGWNESDEECLASIALRPKKKSNDSAKVMVEALECCQRHCYNKFSCTDQHFILKKFIDLENMQLGDRYLANCVQLTSQLVSCNTSAFPSKSDLEQEKGNTKQNCNSMSVEIANESNGNQNVSDEIENAIRESLKDQEMEDISRPAIKNKNDFDVDSELDWTYFIVNNGNLEEVCLTFLLSVHQIKQERIMALKDQIVAGMPMNKLPIVELTDKSEGVWNSVDSHLASLNLEPVPFCRAIPSHIHFTEHTNRRNLFKGFKSYYSQQTGSLPDVSFYAYKRYLQLESGLIFRGRRDDPIACCKVLQSQGYNLNKSKSRSRISDRSQTGLPENLPLKLNLPKKTLLTKKREVLRRKEKSRICACCSETQVPYADVTSRISKANSTKRKRECQHNGPNQLLVENSNILDIDAPKKRGQLPKKERLLKTKKQSECAEHKGNVEQYREKNKSMKAKCEKENNNKKELSRKKSTKKKVVVNNSANNKLNTNNNGKRRSAAKRGDVFSLMHAHLKTMPSTSSKRCRASPHHRFFDPKQVTIQALYDEYRKYFLNATKSELGLRFTTYETIVQRNRTFAIEDINTEEDCPRCHEITDHKNCLDETSAS